MKPSEALAEFTDRMIEQIISDPAAENKLATALKNQCGVDPPEGLVQWAQFCFMIYEVTENNPDDAEGLHIRQVVCVEYYNFRKERRRKAEAVGLDGSS